MEVRIQRLLFIVVFSAQAQMGSRSPIPAERLDISTVMGIEAIFLNGVVQRFGESQGVIVVIGFMVLCQPVNGEGHGIDLFSAVGGSAIGVHRPIYAAMFGR